MTNVKFEIEVFSKQDNQAGKFIKEFEVDATNEETAAASLVEVYRLLNKAFEGTKYTLKNLKAI